MINNMMSDDIEAMKKAAEEFYEPPRRLKAGDIVYDYLLVKWDVETDLEIAINEHAHKGWRLQSYNRGLVAGLLIFERQVLINRETGELTPLKDL